MYTKEIKCEWLTFIFIFIVISVWDEYQMYNCTYMCKCFGFFFFIQNQIRNIISLCISFVITHKININRNILRPKRISFFFSFNILYVRDLFVIYAF